MPAKRTRKKPIASSSKDASVSHKATQSTIATFHTLLRQLNTLQRQASRANEDARVVINARIQDIEARIAAIGGIDAYQHASTLGQSSQRGGDTSKVLVKWLEEMPGVKKAALETPLKMLEIGALVPDNYDNCSRWISNHPLDLNSRHPDITEQDFLQRPVPATEEEKFDIVSCSLVLNFVGDPKNRGRMIQLCRAQLRAQTSSLLFVVLPYPCVNNSRYTTMESFKEFVAAIGFKLLQERWRPNGKVAFWLWSWDPAVKTDLTRWSTKQLLNDGRKRNNFTILV